MCISNKSLGMLMLLVWKPQLEDHCDVAIWQSVNQWGTPGAAKLRVEGSLLKRWTKSLGFLNLFFIWGLLWFVCSYPRRELGSIKTLMTAFPTGLLPFFYRIMHLKRKCRISHCSSVVMSPTIIQWRHGLDPRPCSISDPGSMSCGVGHRGGSDVALLCGCGIGQHLQIQYNS